MTTADPTAQLERRALSLFDQCLDQDSALRDAWLAGACGGDQHLHERVLKLLAADVADQSVLPPIPDSELAARCATEEALRPPPQVGVYRLEELIGAGGMGSVYRAQRNDGLFEQAVAIKFIRRLRGVAEIEPLVDAERKLLARMEHPAIARILDGGRTEEGLHYLIMEFVRGVPLDRFVQERALATRERVALLREVCAAIAHAHQNLVLHCDIKPANILVTAEGRPKLIDFGVARIQDVLDATRPEGFTRGYTSPQRLAGLPAVVADDIYALGVVLGELLGAPARGELAAIVAKATAFEREARYASVAAFDEDLRAWLEQRPVSAVGGEWRYRLRKLIERRPWRVAAGAAALCGLIGALVVISVLYSRAELARSAAEKRFAEVHNLARFMLFDLYDRLDGVPRSLAVRRDVAATSQQFLSGLAADARAPVPLQMEALEALLRLASVQSNQTGSQLGLPDAARANLAQADKLAARLQDAGIAAWRLAQLRAEIFIQQARLYANTDNDLPRADASLSAARAQLDRALPQAPADPQLRWSNADWYAAEAELRTWQTQYAQALALAQRAEQLLAAFPAQQRANRAGRLFTARVDDLIAEARFYSGDALGAEQPYAAELAGLQQDARAFPRDALIARNLVRAQWALGSTLITNHKVQQAVAITRQARAGARELAALDPDNADARHLRDVSEFAYAQALAGAGQADEAVRSFTELIEQRRLASAQAPGNASLARSHAIALFALADIQADQRHRTQACELYARGFSAFAAIQNNGKLTELDRDYALVEARAAQQRAGCR